MQLVLYQTDIIDLLLVIPGSNPPEQYLGSGDKLFPIQITGNKHLTLQKVEALYRFISN